MYNAFSGEFPDNKISGGVMTPLRTILTGPSGVFEKCGVFITLTKVWRLSIYILQSVAQDLCLLHVFNYQ